MKRISTYTYVFIMLFVLSLGLALWRIGYAGLALVAIILGALWGLAQWRGWHRFNTLAFALSIVLVGIGAWAGSPQFWLFLSLVFSIVVWDLGRFARLADSASFVRDEGRMIRAHLIRLGGVLVIGVGLSLLALNLSFRANFDVALILAFVLILSLSRVVGFLRE